MSVAEEPCPPLRLGLLGGGAIAGVYLDAVRADGPFRVDALADLDERVIAARGAALPHLRVHRDPDALLGDPELDAIAIALPHHLHARYATAALTAGKHVICEKPLGLSLADADAVAAAEERSERSVVVRCYLRALAHHRRLRDAIVAGELGMVQMFRALFASDRRSALEDASDWHGDWQRAGGGVVIDSGYHLLDLARHLLGEVDEIRATMFQTHGVRQGGEDLSALTARHASGALTSIACVWSDDLRPFRWERELYGTAGVAFVSDVDGRSELEAHLADGRPLRRRVEDWWATANRLAVEDCAEALARGAEPRDGAVASADARRTLRLALAAYLSAERGTPVRPEAVPDAYSPGPAAVAGSASLLSVPK